MVFIVPNVFQFVSIFERFQMITPLMCKIITTVVSIVIYIILILLLSTGLFKKRADIFKYIAYNFAAIVVWLTLFRICFELIRPDISISVGQMEKIVSLQWTIYGISIAIFLVWYYVVIGFLKDNRPKLYTNPNYTQLFDNIHRKNAYQSSTSSYYRSIVFLVINTITLIFVTIRTYIDTEAPTVMSQALLLIGFFMSICTLIVLFLDIISIGFREKKAMLKGMEISGKEKEELEIIASNIDKANAIINLLEKADDLDVETRKHLLDKVNKYLQIDEEETKKKDSK